MLSPRQEAFFSLLLLCFDFVCVCVERGQQIVWDQALLESEGYNHKIKW